MVPPVIDFLHGLGCEDVPESARCHARRRLLDLLGVAAGGRRHAALEDRARSRGLPFRRGRRRVAHADGRADRQPGRRRPRGRHDHRRARYAWRAQACQGPCGMRHPACPACALGRRGARGWRGVPDRPRAWPRDRNLRGHSAAPHCGRLPHLRGLGRARLPGARSVRDRAGRSGNAPCTRHRRVSRVAVSDDALYRQSDDARGRLRLGRHGRRLGGLSRGGWLQQGPRDHGRG